MCVLYVHIVCALYDLQLCSYIEGSVTKKIYIQGLEILQLHLSRFRDF